MVKSFLMKSPHNLLPAHYKLLYEICSEKRRGKVDRYVYEKDREISVLAECFARYCTYIEYGIPFNDIKIGVGYNGKPYIVNYSNININWSHSGNYIVCGLGDVPIGVDVEIVREAPLEVAEHYFSQRETNVFNNIDNIDVNKYFFMLWTLKESYIKMTGAGLIDLEKCSFTIDMDSKEANCFIGEREEKDLVFSLFEKEDYILAVCSKYKTALFEKTYDNFLFNIVKMNRNLG